MIVGRIQHQVILVPVPRQTSTEEAVRIREIIASLCSQSFIDTDQVKHSIKAENILVVAPYNAQVRVLKELLPETIAIGTVDKFQGQEAEVVIISMTTSSGEEMPRNMEFLFDPHRLNVAISRAKILAILVASPKLLEIDCTTPEQMALVNTLCWVGQISATQERRCQPPPACLTLIRYRGNHQQFLPSATHRIGNRRLAC
ncbi:MAG: C-terminal helicase domain-containing protein [Rugosibacter sp.]|nr:C-terminal helicase domain-containing protein [Rugosibacter sp.]